MTTESEHLSEPAWHGQVWRMGVWLSTTVLYTMAFPPFKLPEGAYVFAVAAVLWCLRSPPWKTFLWITGTAAFASWLVILSWLRALTVQAGAIALVGWFGLAAVMALFMFGWFVALRWAVPRTKGLDGFGRCLIYAGLAGVWVLLEWVRSWLFTGFPWLPLAASQWERPVMLQAAAYGGAWTVSFALVLFNLGLAAYLDRLYFYVKERRSRLCPEFYLGLIGLFAVSFGLYGGSVGQDRELLFKAGAVQPDVPQSVKWDPNEARHILEILQTETQRVAHLRPDVVFWPEAVTPQPLVGDSQMKSWVESLSTEVERPLVLGAVAYEWTPSESGEVNERWSNRVFVVQSDTGLRPKSYAKRHLVPFGEYVPLQRVMPFIKKLVPLDGDFTPGTSAEPLLLRTASRTTQIGALVCYEDTFPSLARSEVKAGAQMLFVATNNAWFGEGGAAYQHAAHSVLRAVETRRPVLRVGNAGWSGWIDEFGVIRDVMRDDRGSIYHRGSGVFHVTRDRRWVDRQSLYVRWGDWFVAVSALLVAAGFWTARSKPLSGTLGSSLKGDGD